MVGRTDSPSDRERAERYCKDIRVLESLADAFGGRLLLHSKAAELLREFCEWDSLPPDAPADELLRRGVFDEEVVVVGVSVNLGIAGYKRPARTQPLEEAGRLHALLSQNRGAYNGLALGGPRPARRGAVKIMDGRLVEGELAPVNLTDPANAWQRHLDHLADEAARLAARRPPEPPPSPPSPTSSPPKPAPKVKPDPAIRSVSELRRRLSEEHGECTEDMLAEWKSWPVPGTRQPLFLPHTFDDAWDALVETVESTIETDDDADDPTIGWIRRHEVCRVGEVWFVAVSSDGPPEVTIVGRFTDPAKALAASRDVVARLTS